MKRLKQIITMFALVSGFGLCLPVATVGAVNVYQPCAPVNGVVPDSSVCASQGESVGAIVGKIISSLLFVVGMVSVVMIIMGGIKYSISGGDPAQVTKAKDTILYAVIGLVVAFTAFAAVNWVMGVLTPSAAQQQCEQSGKTYNKTDETCN